MVTGQNRNPVFTQLEISRLNKKYKQNVSSCAGSILIVTHILEMKLVSL